MENLNNLKESKCVCFVCQETEAKYRCPQCKEKYCSVNCYKKHKEESCTKKEKEESIFIEQDQHRDKPLNLDELQDIIVHKSKLVKLKENKYVMNKLKNKKLQKIIRTIDSAKYKKKLLEKMMNDRDFKEFTDEILETLDYLKNNEFTY